jgi:gamma-polyglutamate biosynthesis protein CapC
MNPLVVSIGIGLLVSLLFSEFFGLVAGGMIVPGYLALYIHQPIKILVSLTLSILTFLITRILSQTIILYGKRRTVLMILIGFLLGLGTSYFFDSIDSMQPIGFIIPGLIAIWMDRQGILDTIATLIIASIFVRLILLLFMGEELIKI